MCSALFHFREHFPSQQRLNRAEAEQICPDYRLIADVANAAKHQMLRRRTPEGSPLILKAEDLTEHLVVTTFTDEEGEYTDARSSIFVDCTDGTKRNLDTAITNVLNFWGERVFGPKFTPRSSPENLDSKFVPRTDGRPVSMEALQGVAWKFSMQLLRFNAQVGRAEPVDLTGANIEFGITSRLVVNVHVSIPGLSRPVCVAFPLNEEESIKWALLKNDADKQAFFGSLDQERRDELQRHLREAIEAELSKDDGCAIT